MSESETPQTDSEKTLQGWVPDVADPDALTKALDEAFDYRGDVTLTLKNGREIEGYVYDRRSGSGLDDSYIRVMPRDQDGKIDIPYGDIARIQFSGRDTAAGKSWETWVRKYAESKLKAKQDESGDTVS